MRLFHLIYEPKWFSGFDRLVLQHPWGVANGQVVTGLKGQTDNVALAAGSNITITPSGNSLTIASNQLSHPFINPLRVATLHWYEANQTNVTYSAPDARHLTFDGVNMWVSNSHLTLLQSYEPVMEPVWAHIASVEIIRMRVINREPCRIFLILTI